MKIKEWFITKPYWLRGALTATIIVGASFGLILVKLGFGVLAVPYGVPFFIILQFFYTIFGTDSTLLFYWAPYSKLGPEPTILTWIIITGIIFLFYFLVGAIIGRMVGRKVKSKS